MENVKDHACINILIVKWTVDHTIEHKLRCDLRNHYFFFFPLTREPIYWCPLTKTYEHQSFLTQEFSNPHDLHRRKECLMLLIFLLHSLRNCILREVAIADASMVQVKLFLSFKHMKKTNGKNNIRSESHTTYLNN